MYSQSAPVRQLGTNLYETVLTAPGVWCSREIESSAGLLLALAVKRMAG